MDYPSAHRAFLEVQNQLSNGVAIDQITDANALTGYHAWINAPALGPLKVILDVPALFIVIIITTIVFRGIRESRTASNIMVLLKLVVIFVVIVLGSFYVHPDNWSPFAPNGLAGVMKGVSAVFFAYIGFDAISTTAEECKNPQRDLPRGMFYALIICTILYVLISIVLTGMVNYTKLNVEDPLAFVFQEAGVNWLAYVISISAVVATASVLLVFQLGQPRIWMSMSRDGLLPKIFSRIHPKFKTPSFSTILTGLLVAIPALFLNLDIVLSLTSIGTLFAFVLVCGGVLVLQNDPDRPKSGFRVPYINGKYIVPALYVLAWVLIAIYNADGLRSTFDLSGNIGLRIPTLTFILVATYMAYASYQKNFSLIPVLGLLACLYLLTGESWTNWARFLIWLAVGLVVYFSYSRRNSKLETTRKEA
ncbi:MAG: amino acid permease [Chitinophagales bacterium]